MERSITAIELPAVPYVADVEELDHGLIEEVGNHC